MLSKISQNPFDIFENRYQYKKQCTKIYTSCKFKIVNILYSILAKCSVILTAEINSYMYVLDEEFYLQTVDSLINCGVQFVLLVRGTLLAVYQLLVDSVSNSLSAEHLLLSDVRFFNLVFGKWRICCKKQVNRIQH